MQLIFVVLVVGVLVASTVAGLRPKTARERTLMWVLFLFLAWALLGFGWLRSA